MVTDNALMVEFPGHVYETVRKARDVLLHRGGLPCPWPGGWFVGFLREGFSLSGRTADGFFGTVSGSGKVMTLSGWGSQDGSSGLVLDSGDFYTALAAQQWFTPFFPREFIPLVSGLQTLPDETVAEETWSKLLLRRVLLEFPLGRDRWRDALTWQILEKRTILPANRDQ